MRDYFFHSSSMCWKFCRGPRCQIVTPSPLLLTLGTKSLQEPCWCPTISLPHSAKHYICSSASLLIHACSPRYPFSVVQTHIEVHQGQHQGHVPFWSETAQGIIHGIIAYSNADWAGCSDTRKSTSGFCVFIGSNLVSWSSRHQNTVSRSNRGRVVGSGKLHCNSCWLRQLLHELHHPPSRATVVYCDNVSAMYMTSNPVHHYRTKHIEIDLHFIRDHAAVGEVRVLHVPTASQFADISTKGLPTIVFEEFQSSLNIYPSVNKCCTFYVMLVTSLRTLRLAP